MGARPPAERVRDAQHLLETGPDLWITTASDGDPWLIPLSFHWTGQTVLMVTPRSSPTYRNLSTGSSARLAFGHTRDVLMIDGDIDLPAQVDGSAADAVADRTGYDPRTEPHTAYISFTPTRAQAWRNAEEVADRTIMRRGEWVV